jgi:general secretion pathway protein M
MDEILNRLRTQLQALTPRERILLGGVGMLAALSLLYFGLLGPVLSARRDAQGRVASAEQELEAVRRLRAEYGNASAALTGVEQRIQQGPSSNLLTTLETLARNSSVKIESMEPQAAASSDRYRETKVQLVLKGVTLSQTVSYLQQLETAPQPLSIKSLRLRTRTDNPELLDVTFTVSSFEAV